jgi:uncharacterized membrane protein
MKKAMSLFWTLLIFAFEKKAEKTSDEKESANALANAKFLGAAGMAMAGIFTIITAVCMRNSFGATMVMLVYLCVTAIITVVYAHKVYIQELESEGKR